MKLNIIIMITRSRKCKNYLILGENQAGVAEVVGAGGKHFVK